MRGRGENSVATSPRGITRARALGDAINSQRSKVAKQIEFIEEAYRNEEQIPSFKNFGSEVEEKTEEMIESLQVLEEMGEEKNAEILDDPMLSGQSNLESACLRIARFYYKKGMYDKANLFLQRMSERAVYYSGKKALNESGNKLFKQLEKKGRIPFYQEFIKGREEEIASKGIQKENAHLLLSDELYDTLYENDEKLVDKAEYFPVSAFLTRVRQA